MTVESNKIRLQTRFRKIIQVRLFQFVFVFAGK
jgi:hypothetical protein